MQSLRKFMNCHSEEPRDEESAFGLILVVRDACATKIS